jgi:hypothetical protein
VSPAASPEITVSAIDVQSRRDLIVGGLNRVEIPPPKTVATNATRAETFTTLFTEPALAWRPFAIHHSVSATEQTRNV